DKVWPDDIAEMVLFLPSDQDRAITAQEFVVDAGWKYASSPLAGKERVVRIWTRSPPSPPCGEGGDGHAWSALAGGCPVYPSPYRLPAQSNWMDMVAAGRMGPAFVAGQSHRCD